MEASSIVAAPDALRARLHGLWTAVAGSWGEHAEYVDLRAAGVTQRMLAFAAPRQGERVLELACGAGGTGLAAAALVGPEGEVILSDFAAEMVAIAAARAEAAGARNVGTRVLDLERIDEPSASYDVALCREGIMFAPNPERAAREIARVLRRGGRVSIAVWGPRERNPWLGLVFDAVSAQTGGPVPPPGVPGPFSLGDPARLVALLTDAGFSDVRLRELATPLSAASFEEWWQRTSALAGPLAKILADLPAGAMQALRARLQESVRPYMTESGAIEIPGLNLVASGVR
jgi:ubiquinone/menaquinone biosynthesis C-methylase UbiE